MALDVALIPDEEMMNQAIQVNRRLLAQEDGGIRLGHCLESGVGLPHLSLCMFFASPSSLDDLRLTLAECLPRAGPALGTIESIMGKPNKHGGKTISYGLRRSDDLLCLHKNVMKTLTPYFEMPGSTDHFVKDDGLVRQSDADWINNFERDSSQEFFDPHITLGFGETEETPLHQEIRFDRLGLYHLGACCTCRKEIASFKLRAS